jgi:oxalate decarboxylase/phosphoglucose isomerase-like protein (cupin superfamily)
MPRATVTTGIAAPTSGSTSSPGTGTATINGRRHPMRAGTLLLIERRDKHEIKNTGRGPLRTLNVYVPPAYTKSGDELPRGRK